MESNGCFFFNDTATTEIYTLSLHDALPISSATGDATKPADEATAQPEAETPANAEQPSTSDAESPRSEEHTSELQSRQYLVCRLLLEKKTTLISSWSVFPPVSSS